MGLWETPADLAEALSQAVGGFDMHPCAASADRRRTRIKAKIVLTEADDGLSVPWTGKVFVNPPYGRGISNWIRKCFEESQRAACAIDYGFNMLADELVSITWERLRQWMEHLCS